MIKLHALMEASLTYAICIRLNAPELERVVARLDTSNNQSGKLAFAKALDILQAPQRKFIRRLSELRNEIVHNVRAVEFNFDSYKASLTEKENYRFCSDLSLHELFHKDQREGEIELITFVNEVPKYGITQAGLVVIGDLMLHVAKGEASSAHRKLGEKIIASMEGLDYSDQNETEI